MSIHRSLKVKGNIAGKKNVLKRFERVDQLIKEGRLKAGEPVLGLPKTKVNI
jgi:small basic protein (TIGR04137 family)